MLQKTYKILKYIYKNPNISKSELKKKFSDFEKYQSCISSYVSKTNNNVDIERKTEEESIEEAHKLGLSNAELAKYVKEHTPDNVQNITDNSLIVYSTNLTFDEYHEKKKARHMVILASIHHNHADCYSFSTGSNFRVTKRGISAP